MNKRELKVENIMKITFWGMSEAAKLTDFYNQQIATLSYGYPVLPEEFERSFCYQFGEALEKHKPVKELAAFSERKLIVGSQDRKIVGFAHVGKQEMEGGEIGHIRFMTYRPGCRPVGSAILEAAENYFRDLGLSRFEAFRGGYYVFRFGNGALPTSMWHVHALFGINGYRFATWEDGERVGWFFFHFPHYPIKTHPPPSLDLEVDIQQISGRGELPNLEILLRRNGGIIGSSWSVSGEHYCLNPEARTVFCTESFGLYEPEDRGKRLGRYLMQLTLWEMRKLGYQTATLCCSLPNYRAHLLYTNTGYRVVDHTCAFVKDLDEYAASTNRK